MANSVKFSIPEREIDNIGVTFVRKRNGSKHGTITVRQNSDLTPTSTTLSQQLPRYVSVMEQAGFNEIMFPEMANKNDGRVWRAVPNRKWYASQRGFTSSSNEVVLFHKLARAGSSSLAGNHQR